MQHQSTFKHKSYNLYELLFLQMRKSGARKTCPNPTEGFSDRVRLEPTSPDNMSRPLFMFHVSERERLREISFWKVAPPGSSVN